MGGQFITYTLPAPSLEHLKRTLERFPYEDPIGRGFHNFRPLLGPLCETETQAESYIREKTEYDWGFCIVPIKPENTLWVVGGSIRD